MGEMQDQSDAQLLRAYVESGQETAFREIVTRHADLVYSAALRQVNSPDLARDLAQGVFTDLARKARPLAEKLADGSSLAGWLYRSTRFAALKHLRDDRRRLTHERQAMEQLIINSETAPDWEQVRPVLDETMADLNDEDREALLLRYFKNCDFQTVGRALGVSDAAAQKRVSRALDKLREHMSRRGITTTAATLSAAISVNAVQSAPIGLAATLSTSAVAGTPLTAAAATATKTIAMTTLQKAIIGATLAAAVGTGIYEARQASNARAQVETLRQQQAPLNGQVQQLTRERDDAGSQLAALRDEIKRLNRNPSELLKLRGEVGQLREQNRNMAKANAGDQAKLLSKGFGNLGEYVPSEAASNAGNSTPEALLKTFIYAMREGNVPLLEKFGVPSIGQSTPGDAAGEISAATAALFKTIQTAFTNSAGFRLSSKAANNGQAYEVRLDAEPLRGNQDGSFKNVHLSMYMERKDDGWSFGTNPSDDSSSQSK
jgi:RNA polymerase sigma factor (sigma-70 family)